MPLNLTAFQQRIYFKLENVASHGIHRAERLGVLNAARLAPVLGEGFLGSLRAVSLGRVVFLLADKRHEPAEPLDRLRPLVRYVDERVWLEANGVARTIVVVVDLARVLEPPAFRQQSIAMAEGDLAELRGDLMVGVVVVRPEGERHVGLDLRHGLGDGPLAGFGYVVLDPGKIEQSHLRPVFLANLNRAIDNFTLPPLGRPPIGLIAD